MILRRTCPHCSEKSISALQVLNLILGQSKQNCSNCGIGIELSNQGFFTKSIFWYIEAVIYSLLVSISWYYKSWLIFSFGLCISASIELFMLLHIPILFVGKRNRVDKII